eukprot:4493417-Pleurochrysis_carterae.AAC.1
MELSSTILSQRVQFVRARRVDSHARSQGYDHPIFKVEVLNPKAKRHNESNLSLGNGSAAAAAGGAHIKGGVNAPRETRRLQALLDAHVLQWRGIRGAGPGLANLSSSAFLNAPLQCLTHTPALANISLDRAHSRSCNAVGWCAYCEVESHIRLALTTKERTVAPSALVSRSSSPSDPRLASQRAASSPRALFVSNVHDGIDLSTHRPPTSSSTLDRPQDRSERDVLHAASKATWAWASILHCFCSRSVLADFFDWRCARLRMLSRDLRPGRQHDAHEVLLGLLQHMQVAQPCKPQSVSCVASECELRSLRV